MQNPVKLYGHFFSAPANQVRLSASAMRLEHEYIHVDLMKGEQHEDAFQTISVFGKVPAMDDNGFTLSESGVICRYLGSKSGSPLYPDDPQARAKTEMWMDYASMHVRAAMSKVLFNTLFAPMMGREVDEKSMAEGRDMLSNQLPHVECALTGTKYLAADELSLADTAMIAAMEPFEMIKVSLADFPRIDAWRKTIMQSDWYKGVHAHYAAEMDAG